VAGRDDLSRELGSLVVLAAGSLAGTGDPWEPYRLTGPDGARVEAVSEFLRDLRAAGRPATTQRSYGLALLRWFRFTWAVDVSWDQATRTEARDFCRGVQLAGKPGGARAAAVTVPGKRPASAKYGTPVIISGGGYGDGTVRVWRLADGSPVGEPLRGHDGGVTAVAAGASPDGTPVIISGGGDGTVRVWRLADGTPLVPPLYLSESVRGSAVHGNVIVTAAGTNIAVHQLALPPSIR
jgi:WD40 repeat protein